MKFTTGTSRAAIAAMLVTGYIGAAAAQTLAPTPTPTPTPISTPVAEATSPPQSVVESDGQQEGNDIIVTGTRATGITAAESAAPIKVLDAETLSHVGSPTSTRS